MNTNPNTCTALVITTRTTRHAQRVELAQNRHQNQTPAVIALYARPNMTPAERAYATYNGNVRTALKRPMQYSPNPVLRAISSAHYAELTRLNLTDIVTQATEEARKADTARAEADQARRDSRKLRRSPDQRSEDARLADRKGKEADTHRARAEAMLTQLEETLTDRADLLQVCALADLEQPTARELRTVMERAGIDPEQLDKLTPAELAQLQYKAHDKHRINAVSKYIRQQGSQTAYDTTHTDSTPATEEAIKAWTQAGKTFDERYQTKAGSIALEYLAGNETRPAGLYFVTRRYTYNSAHSLEKLNEAGDITGYIRTQNTYADSLGALEALEELYNSAELNKRQREYIALFTSPEARTAEQEARNAYEREHRHSKTKDRKKLLQGMSRAGHRARTAYAFDHLEEPVKSPSARSNFMDRLKGACERANRARQAQEAEEARRAYQTATPAQQTRARARAKARQAEELARRDFLYWEYMTRSNRGTAGEPTARPVDLLEAMRQKTADMSPAPVVAWKTCIDLAQLRTISPEQLHAEQTAREETERARIRAHADEIARLEIRQSLTRYHEPAPVIEWHGRAGAVQTTTRTPLNAQTIAFKIWERMTPAEQLEAVKEEARQAQARADRKRAYHEAMTATGMYSLNSTLEQWRAWTPEQRQAHMDYVNNYSK